MMATQNQIATVLLVDDDDDVRLVTGMLLERTGYTVIGARDGQDGLDQLAEHVAEVDVVLLDIMMPRLSGHDAFPRIRELRPDLPVIFFSGYGHTEVASHLLAEDAHTSFLPKPSDVAVLDAEIRRALGR